MKRNLALFILILIVTFTMTVAGFAQTPAAVEKPAVKTSTTTVKVGPQAPAAKPSPATVAKPASVQAHPAVPVQPATVKVAPTKPSTAAATVAATGKASAGPSMKPVTVVAAPSKPVAAGVAKTGTASAPKTTTASTTQVKTATIATKPAVAVVQVKSAPAKSEVKASPLSPKAPAAQPASQNTSKPGTTVAVHDGKATTESKKPEPTRANANGRRDPFISPVVNMSAIGSGCSSGKRCLAIDQVALKGIVKSDVGMIAVVVNSIDKAYFLRENDPVFNGYVLKITGDSIVFKETFKDRLGKPLTRDVTKTITRPAV
jgi:hypothetical protein